MTFPESIGVTPWVVICGNATGRRHFATVRQARNAILAVGHDADTRNLAGPRAHSLARRACILPTFTAGVLRLHDNFHGARMLGRIH